MIYAIGDIHGELTKLESLVGKIGSRGLKESDRLVFVGDYVDRGPSSSGVLDFLIELRSRHSNCVFLRGNHDQVMLDARDVFDRQRKTDKSVEDINWWFSFGGRETIDSYPPGMPWYKRIPDSHWQFLEETTFEFSEGPYVFVHAGLVPPGQKWSQPEDPRLWIREEFIGSTADFGKIVVFGHTPQDLLMPTVMANKVGIDTGAAYGGPLTALVLNPSAPYVMEKLEFITAR